MVEGTTRLGSGRFRSPELQSAKCKIQIANWSMADCGDWCWGRRRTGGRGAADRAAREERLRPRGRGAISAFAARLLDPVDVGASGGAARERDDRLAAAYG